jgi:hypothetical protein
MSLNRAIEHAQRHPRRGDLDLRDLRPRGLVANRVHQAGGAQREQARLIDLDAGFGDVRANGALLRERLAECDAALDARAHQLQRTLGHTNDAHAVVNPAGPEARLRDLDPRPSPSSMFDAGTLHVVKHDLGVPCGASSNPNTGSVR